MQYILMVKIPNGLFHCLRLTSSGMMIDFILVTHYIHMRQPLSAPLLLMSQLIQ
ncbi:unnamed protein product [Acanthoscelides obtectus]|uniref:Uncharacterized protein n=1 Tax=Acanthoscelides obtectus TaxID=200917 RepID=A0A9P0Q1S5_ACAOB|nr:unnamed protein product [Acanthoscelides obtectus]CAK1668559.1 hypothetical protein AOBTE_LOCUS26481 [Acanthoscelides obtectus]